MLIKYLRSALLTWFAAGLLMMSGTSLHAQNTGIGSAAFVPNPSAMLEIQAGAANNKGLLIPRVTNAQRLAMNPLPAAAQGLIVYQTNVAGLSLEGFYYNISITTVPNWIYLDPSGGGGGSGWELTGNAGTTPAVNFIGTTDIQDWVIKTDNQERARFLAGGQVRINNTSISINEVFTVLGSGATGATDAVGTDAINGYTTSGGIAVYGENNDSGVGVWGVTSGSGVGVRGDNTSPSTANSTTSHGMYASNSSAPTGTGIAVGLGGYATSGALDARGINGQSQSTSGIGVAGFNTAPSGPNFNAHGVFGQTSSQSASGVEGVNTALIGSAHGIQGTSSSVGAGAGVRGFNNNTPGSGGNTYGVRGSANGIPTGSGTVFGVRGDCSTISGTAYGTSGVVGTPTGFGSHGYNSNASGTGILGTGNGVGGNYLVSGSGGAFTGSETGVFAIGTTNGSSTGLLGVSNGAALTTLVSGSGISGSSDLIGVAGWANSVAFADRAGGYFDVNGGASYAYVGAITVLGVNRKIEGNGTVNTTVKDLNGNLVVLSCPESPENLFQDFGKGRLVNGKAHIDLDPVFTKNILVDETHPLRVFIQLGGDCKGVYVNNETSSGFDVTELQNGNSDAPFTWFATANRADEVNPDGTVARYSSERFAPAIGPAGFVKKEKIAARNTTSPDDSPLPVTVKPLPPDTTRTKANSQR